MSADVAAKLGDPDFNVKVSTDASGVAGDVLGRGPVGSAPSTAQPSSHRRRVVHDHRLAGRQRRVRPGAARLAALHIAKAARKGLRVLDLLESAKGRVAGALLPAVRDHALFYAPTSPATIVASPDSCRTSTTFSTLCMSEHATEFEPWIVAESA